MAAKANVAARKVRGLIMGATVLPAAPHNHRGNPLIVIRSGDQPQAGLIPLGRLVTRGWAWLRSSRTIAPSPACVLPRRSAT